MAVGGDRGRAAISDVDREVQAALARHWIEGLTQVCSKPRQGYGLGPNLDVPGFDLRQIEDVVDEIEQIVARRLDGAGELDLFVREIALRVVAQQLGQDQQRVERRAQLMGHVGQEVRLVAAGLLQLPRLQLHGRAGAGQVVALDLELLGLFLELGVGLFELDLLLLQSDLMFLQGAALLLQLLVGDAQLLALDL